MNILEQLEATIEGEERKSVFNLVPCDNDFEYEFAKSLEGAKDREYGKLQPVEFCDLETFGG